MVHISDHPRWETRDQRDSKAYGKALATFSRKYPQIESSPGGRSPMLAFLGSANSVELKDEHVAKITVPLYCRNATEPIHVAIVGSELKRLPANSVNSDEFGKLRIVQEAACPTDPSGRVEFLVPSQLAAGGDRKFKASVLVIGAKSRPLDQSNEFSFKVPK
ncbi:MAG TPA: hypothetical protein VN622_03535 [Clostridia bacterium]|nr:hypothetical protein [Clostridia bacterium]